MKGRAGLLLDPFNGVADIEAKLLRILHNYSFVEDPSRLIRATRFAARFHWPMEERTQQRYDAAKENKYIDHISKSAVGHEIAQLAHEDDPLNVVRALEKEDWLKVLHPHWSSAKVDTNGLGQLMKTRQQMVDLGYTVDPSAAVMHFLTARLSDKDISDLRRQIPRKDLIESWRDIEDHAKELAKRLNGKEAATPIAHLESAVFGATGDDFIFGGDGAATDRGAEDQEFPDQVAAGSATHSAA